jgi:hypothetical protein
MSSVNVFCNHCASNTHTTADCVNIQIANSSWRTALILTLLMREGVMILSTLRSTVFQYLYMRQHMDTIQSGSLITREINQTNAIGMPTFADETNTYFPQTLVFDNSASAVVNMVEEVVDVIDIPLPSDPVHNVVIPSLLCLETPEELGEMVTCAICYEDKTRFQFDSMKCSHEFCHDCLVSHIQKKGWEHNVTCPMCRENVDSVITRDPEYFQEYYCKFSRCSGFLKDAMVATFGDDQFQELCKISYCDNDFIHMLLENFSDHELYLRVRESDSDEEKAVMLRDYAYRDAERRNLEDEYDDSDPLNENIDDDSSLYDEEMDEPLGEVFE